MVINEILENAVAKEAGFAGDFADRVAVENEGLQGHARRPGAEFPQPFHLPFEELRTFLGHFERKPCRRGGSGNATGDALARLRLGLPPKDLELITATNASLRFLRRIYGIQFTEAGGPSTRSTPSRC